MTLLKSKSDLTNSRLNAIRAATNHLGKFFCVTDESIEDIYADYVRDGIAEFSCDATATDGRTIPILIKIGRPVSRRKGKRQ